MRLGRATGSVLVAALAALTACGGNTDGTEQDRTAFSGGFGDPASCQSWQTLQGQVTGLYGLYLRREARKPYSWEGDNLLIPNAVPYGSVVQIVEVNLYGGSYALDEPGAPQSSTEWLRVRVNMWSQTFTGWIAAYWVAPLGCQPTSYTPPTSPTNPNPPAGEGWSALPGHESFTSNPSGIFDHNGDLRLYFRADNSSVHERIRDEQGWMSWSYLVHGGTRGVPSAVVGPYNHIHVFIRGNDDKVYTRTRRQQSANYGSWGDWRRVDTKRTTPYSPAAAMDRYGNLRVFITGDDNKVYESSCTPSPYFDCTFGAFQPLATGSTNRGPAVVRDAAGELQLFVRGADGVIYRNARSTDSWSAIAASDPMRSEVGPSAVLDAQGQVRIFAMSGQGHLLETTSHGSSWAVLAPPFGGTDASPGVVLDGNQVRLFARSLHDNKLYTTTR